MTFGDRLPDGIEAAIPKYHRLRETTDAEASLEVPPR
jgi:hypothetical protein